MALSALGKIFGSKHERDANKLLPYVDDINEEFEKLNDLSDDQLREKTAAFRARIKDETSEIEKEIAELRLKLQGDVEGEERRKVYKDLEDLEEEFDDTIADILDEILPEAFAVVKEACRRLVGQSWDVTGHKIVWDMVPFDVQLMGAVVLHDGKIADVFPACRSLREILCRHAYRSSALRPISVFLSRLKLPSDSRARRIRRLSDRRGQSRCNRSCRTHNRTLRRRETEGCSSR